MLYVFLLAGSEQALCRTYGARRMGEGLRRFAHNLRRQPGFLIWIRNRGKFVGTHSHKS